MDSRRESIREATVEDAEGILALAQQLAGTVGDATPREEDVRARLEQLLEEPRAHVLVAEVGGDVAGAASLWVKPDLAHGDVVVEVPMLAVADEYRRGGLGRLLIERVREVAAESDATIIELVATRANVAAREFYRSLGFVEADVVPLEFHGNNHDLPPRT